LKHNNIDFGRPWSGWVGLNVIAERLSGPYISYTNSQLTGGGRNWRHRINFVSGRGEPGASVHVHMPGVLAQWVGVDGAGNWSTHIGRQDPNRRIEAQQYRLRKTLVWMDRNKCCRKVCWA